MSKKRAYAPHCDQSILHAPGTCDYCDDYPDWQEMRELWRMNFSNTCDESKAPCPSQHFRPAEVRDRWPGNTPEGYPEPLVNEWHPQPEDFGAMAAKTRQRLIELGFVYDTASKTWREKPEPKEMPKPPQWLDPYLDQPEEWGSHWQVRPVEEEKWVLDEMLDKPFEKKRRWWHRKKRDDGRL